MNILIIGNGGREHALAWKVKQSPRCNKLFIAPGNAGTSLVGENVNIGIDDFESIASFCVKENVALLVVGPEVPLVRGLRNYIEQVAKLNILIVGPGKEGAQLEGSKDFSKQFMIRHGIPTAKAQTFSAVQVNDALNYVSKLSAPIVLKADGLAAGKGVVIAQSVKEAQSVLVEMLQNKKFGEASAKVLIEEFLDGIELSVFVLTDGKDYVVLPEAKDYKRIGNGDTGPNTGGMGAVSPVPFANRDFMKKIEDGIIKPTVRGLASERIDYKGFIFFGLIKVKGEPLVIEYNSRMGDPETQVVMPRIDNDLVDLLEATARGELAGKSISINPNCAITVCLVSGGYPGDYEKGKPISGLDAVSSIGSFESGKAGAIVFHAGTRQSGNEVVTDGGRVVAATGVANTLEFARESAYRMVSQLRWDGVSFRNDIGVDLIKLQTP